MAAQAGFRAHFKSQLVNRPHLLGRSRLDPPKPKHLRQRFRVLEESGCRRVVLTTNHNNTMTAGASKSLMWKLMAWENNYHIRAVLLEGRKSNYSCGWDKWTLLDQGPEVAARALERYQQLTYLVGTMRKPTISCYNGEVLGSGLGVGLGRHRISTSASALQVTAPSYGWCLDGAQSFVLPNLRLGGDRSPHRQHALALARYLALTGSPLVGHDLVLAGVSTHHVTKTHANRVLAGYFADLTYESCNDYWHAEHLVTGISEMHYMLDRAFTTDPYAGLLDKWEENDDERAEMRAGMLEEVGVDGEGEEEEEYPVYGEEEEEDEDEPSMVFDKRLKGGVADDVAEDDDEDDETQDDEWEEEEEEEDDDDDDDKEGGDEALVAAEEGESSGATEGHQGLEDGDNGDEVMHLFDDGPEGEGEGEEGEEEEEEGEGEGEVEGEFDLPDSMMDKAMSWNPHLMEAEDEEQDMVDGAEGENEPEPWRRLPDTAWLHLNFADRHEAAWRAHADRLSEEILDKVTDEDLDAAAKLALTFGPEEGDAPDYVNYPERTHLVDTMQSYRQPWLDAKSARIKEQYEALGYTKEDMEKQGLKTEVDVSSIDIDKAYPEFAQLIHNVATCFSGESVEEVVERLRADDSPWAQDCLARMARMSPTSLKLVWRQLEEGDLSDFDQALRAEHRVATRLLQNPDVLAAMRMGLGDTRGLRPGETAPWANRTLESITADEIESYFQPLPEEQELQLPTRTFDGGRETVGLKAAFAKRTRTSA